MTYDSPLTDDDAFMRRCLQLATMGAGYVAPNPMVGAVLVYKNKIIGEGYHKKFGQEHAEVNCIEAFKKQSSTKIGLVDQILQQSTLYVSLEPCVHFGKTPPCTDLIIKNKIPKVVIGCVDPFREVRGKGVEKLRSAGVEVKTGVLEKECIETNKRFFTFHQLHRPYIILKWAQTINGKIAASIRSSSELIYEDSLSPRNSNQRLMISNEYTNRLVHKWRSEEASILIGTNTALFDNPELSTRHWTGVSPVRLIVDMDLRLPASLKIFHGNIRTIVFNSLKHEKENNLLYYQVTKDVSLVHQILNAAYQLNIQSVLIEGGARLLQSFIDDRVWDEARIITNQELRVTDGLSAPELEGGEKIFDEEFFTDRIEFFKHKSTDV